MRSTLSLLIELLAAVPSVILGLWGIFVMVPWLRQHLFPSLRDVFGFNRAKHAVLEAAILATRLHILPEDDVRRQFDVCPRLHPYTMPPAWVGDPQQQREDRRRASDDPRHRDDPDSCAARAHLPGQLIPDDPPVDDVEAVADILVAKAVPFDAVLARVRSA